VKTELISEARNWLRRRRRRKKKTQKKKKSRRQKREERWKSVVVGVRDCVVAILFSLCLSVSLSVSVCLSELCALGSFLVLILTSSSAFACPFFSLESLEMRWWAVGGRRVGGGCLDSNKVVDDLADRDLRWVLGGSLPLPFPAYIASLSLSLAILCLCLSV